MSVVAGGAVVAAKFGGAGLIVYTIGRVFMFLCDFAASRWDAHVRRVAEREALADASIATRLKHLEAGQGRDAIRLAALERCVGILTVAVREISPGHVSLTEVAEIIAASLNIVDPRIPPDMADTLGRA